MPINIRKIEPYNGRLWTTFLSNIVNFNNMQFKLVKVMKTTKVMKLQKANHEIVLLIK